MQLFILLSFQHCDKRFLTSVWKHVEEQRPQASQNDFSLLGQPGGGGLVGEVDGETGSYLLSAEDDLVGPTKSNKWQVAKSSSLSHRHEEVLTQCVRLKPQRWGPLTFTIGTEGAPWTHYIKLRNLRVCVCVCSRLFGYTGPINTYAHLWRYATIHTIARQFLLVQYEKKFTSLASCAVCYVSSNCWE